MKRVEYYVSNTLCGQDRQRLQLKEAMIIIINQQPKNKAVQSFYMQDLVVTKSSWLVDYDNSIKKSFKKGLT